MVLSGGEDTYGFKKSRCLEGVVFSGVEEPLSGVENDLDVNDQSC